MKVFIIGPEKTIYQGNADAVKVPGFEGSFQMLNNHAPIVSALKAGLIEIENPDKDLSQNLQHQAGNSYAYEIVGGVLEMNHECLSILVQ